ncbi:hypothetical protein G7062_05715 [Erysipelothrix sp. HDW6C]|uniref:hypothetical protein n=1 Tax=Erysipelothrix sp. HDW6C TaxID=2714930 RepID=UPI00140D3916|nr:hypothetical protein [Erysipelothrix sp. HDW6C]QIK69822.1 hypothetical protein G7062_05715 [Erysipelothrix sp. HDW6C]
MQRFFDAIPRWLSSRVSIFIYLFLFFYLVVFPVVTSVVPAIVSWAPSSMTQLILGNYTNVLSALGASIAAGSGVVVHKKVTTIQKNHDAMKASLDSLHEKLDAMNSKDVDA